MGNSHPSPDDGDDEFAEFDGIETLGYRVLGVQPNSPAAEAGLVSFLDFIVGANGEMLLGSGEDLEEGDEYDDIDFPQLLRENKGKAIELLVWNIKSREKRVVELVPSEDWGGAGLLGVTIRMDNYGGADERLIRVLEVEQSSPASIAGLVPLQDFLLGTTAAAFGSTQILATILQDHIDEVIEVYVYNSESDIVRVVALMPTLSWGPGRGLLGAEVGTGYLHRLPNNCRGTIGRSVERKVRWVQKQEDGEDPADPSLPIMEPHLEMEVERDESSNQRPEDRSKQAHELGKIEVEHPKEKEASSLHKNTEEESIKKEESSSTQETDLASSKTEASSLDVPIHTQSTEPGESKSVSENLFSGPPPDSQEPTSEEKEKAEKEEAQSLNGSSSSLSTIPLPPKMSD